MHQRRAAEALAQQREQQATAPRFQPNITSKVGSDKILQSTADVAAEMDRMDRLMAVHAPPPPPPNPPPKPPVLLANSSSAEDGSPKGEFFSDYDEEKKNGSPSSSEESDDELGPEVGFKKEFPHTDDYNEGFPDDLPRSARKKPASSLPSAPEVSESDGDASSVSSSQSDYRRTIMSSIDAFEASFSTNFPDSFSSSPQEEKVQATSEIYNPFFPSPRRGIPESSQPTQSEIAKARSGPALPRSYNEPSMPVSQISSPATNDKGAVGVPALRPRSTGAVELEEFVPRTPPKVTREVTPSSRGTPTSQDEKREPRTPISLICRKVSSDEYDEPRRPEKSASASARARYEKALQSRNYQAVVRSDDDSGSKPEKENSAQLHSQKKQTESDPQSSKPATPATQSTPPVKTPNQVLLQLQQRMSSSPGVSTSLRNASPSPVKSANHKAESPQIFKQLSTAVFLKTRPIAANKTSEPVNHEISHSAKTPEIFVAKNGVSPSVSSAINVFEQASKRNEGFSNISGSRSIKPLRSASFGAMQPNRPTSPGLPFDEYESPLRSSFKALSTRELGLIARNQSDEESAFLARRNYTRVMSARGLQPLAKRSSGQGNPNWQNEDEYREADSGSFHSRIKRSSELPLPKGVEPPSNVGQTGATTSAVVAGGTARNSLRNVTKPMSYAEPSLNSKLRQGDVFFAKNDSDKGTGTEDVRKDLLASVRL